MSDFDIDAFLASGPSASQQVKAPSLPQPKQEESQPFDIDSFIADAPTPPQLATTGEDAPEYADGLSPKSPLNVNPISMVDRFKIKALGNVQGSLKYLKQNYQDATTDRHGNLLVKNEGLWHQVDPDGRGEGDAWQKTKEILSDLGDIVPELATVAGTTAAGATTLGTGVLAAGAISGAVASIRTTLGRAVGTYDATPEEEVKDIAFESLLNMGGTVIGAGVKPSFNMISSGLRKTGEALSKVPEASRNVVASVLGSTSSAGAVAVHELAANPVPVTAALNSAKAGARGAPEIVGNLVRSSTKSVKNIVDAVPKAINDIYKGMREELVTVGEKVGLTGTVDDVVKSGYGFLEGSGLGKVVKGKFELTPHDEIKMLRQTVGDVDVNAIVPTGKDYLAIKKLVNELNGWAGTKARPGKAGIEQMMSFKKTVNDLTWSMRNQAKQTPGQSPAIPRFLAAVHERMESKVVDTFSKVVGADGKPIYPTLNAAFSKAQKEFKGILKIANSDDPKAYEALFKRISSVPSNHQGEKDAILAAVDLAERAGNKEVAGEFKQIAYNEAARGFASLIKPGMVSSLSTMGLGAAAVGTMGIVPGIAATAALTSPRATMMAVKAGGAAARVAGKVTRQAVQPIQVFTKAMGDGKQWLSQRTPEQMKVFLNSPQALDTFFRTIGQAPAVKDTVHQQLMQPLQQINQDRPQFHQPIPQKGGKK